MFGKRSLAILVAGLTVTVTVTAAPAAAAETIAYRYDARGRLIEVARTGTVNHGATTAYVFDKADNRVVKTTAGSPNPPPP